MPTLESICGGKRLLRYLISKFSMSPVICLVPGLHVQMNLMLCSSATCVYTSNALMSFSLNFFASFIPTVVHVDNRTTFEADVFSDVLLAGCVSATLHRQFNVCG